MLYDNNSDLHNRVDLKAIQAVSVAASASCGRRLFHQRMQTIPHPSRIPWLFARLESQGNVAVSLHRFTWHAGPFFDDPIQDFFNLELADTNQVDHYNCLLNQRFGPSFRF